MAAARLLLCLFLVHAAAAQLYYEPPCNPKNCPSTTCPNPIPPGPNQCCPRCRQDCRVVLCLRPPCDNPIFPPGECCGECPITISPITVVTTSPPPTTATTTSPPPTTATTTSPPPTTATTNPPSPCDGVTCPPIYCPRPIPPGPKQCCSRCLQDCRLVRCGRPPCSNSFVPLGKCCRECPATPTPPTSPTPPTCSIKGQVYKECGSACPPTCANPTPICTLQCQAGCMCPTGTVLDTVKNVCVSQSKCTCPPTCSRDYCRKNPKSVCSNTGPREIPGCTGQCQLTLCRACYYSSSCFSRPTSCPTCYTRFTGKRLQRCLKYWAHCVRKKYRYRRVTKQQCPAGSPKFKCWNPPCPLRG